MVIDYLDKTYFYNKSSPWSLSLWTLFLELRMLNAHQPLSSEHREILKEDTEMLALLEKWDQEMLEKQKL